MSWIVEPSEMKIRQNNPVRYTCWCHPSLHFETHNFDQIPLVLPGMIGSQVCDFLSGQYCFIHPQWCIVLNECNYFFPLFWVFYGFLYDSTSFCICTLLYKMPLYIYSLDTLKPSLPKTVKMFPMINRREYFAKTKWTNKENKWGHFYHL